MADITNDYSLNKLESLEKKYEEATMKYAVENEKYLHKKYTAGESILVAIIVVCIVILFLIFPFAGVIGAIVGAVVMYFKSGWYSSDFMTTWRKGFFEKYKSALSKEDAQWLNHVNKIDEFPVFDDIAETYSDGKWVCPKCNSKNNEDDAFCIKCGNSRA